jgi:hypothetical protein
MGKNPLEPTPLYDAGWSLLKSSERKSVFHALDLYRNDPTNPSLRVHTPRWYDSSTISISADDDLRILLRVRPDGSILLLDVGNHERVYGE